MNAGKSLYLLCTNMAALGRQWQFADGADAWVWLARALAAKLMLPAPPHARAHGQVQTHA